MCAIFGLIDYNHTLNAKQRENVLRILSQECEERGTDATGFAYNSRGKLTIFKRPFAAHNVHLKLREDANVIMGHTRMATQGNKLDNRNLVSLKESIDTTTSTGKLLFTLMSAIAQFERDVIADRTREGLNSARARGRKGGRPRTDSDKLRKAIKLYNTHQYSLAEIEDMTGVKRSTLYRGIRSKNG